MPREKLNTINNKITYQKNETTKNTSSLKVSKMFHDMSDVF